MDALIILLKYSNTAIQFIFIGVMTDVLIFNKHLPKISHLLKRVAVLFAILLIWSYVIDPLLVNTQCKLLKVPKEKIRSEKV